MAFITKSGNRYAVRHGTAFNVLKTFGSHSGAEKYKNALHKEHDPLSAHRDASARKAFRASDADMPAALKRRTGRGGRRRHS